MGDYYRDSERVPQALARAGFTVVTFDQVGFATRLMDGVRNFYRRHPTWSMLGEMVGDVSSAVDALLGQNGPNPDGLPLYSLYDGCRFPEPLGGQVFVAGYSLGGLVALHAAALDERLAGAASIAGFTPFRNDSLAATIGGNRRLYDLHGVLPRLGWFRDGSNEALPLSQWPYDIEDLLVTIGERNAPALVYAPSHDRVSNAPAVAQSIMHARKVLPKGGQALTFEAPEEVSKLDD